MRLRTILIEDELPALEAVESVIANHCPDVEVIGKAQNVSDAFKLIHDLKPDLVISDIELEDKTVFDLLDNLPEINFKIIFVTGHNAFAIKAFKMCAIDYLMKPLNEIELVSSIDKAKSRLNSDALLLQVNYLKDQLKGKESKKIIFKTSDQIRPVSIADIIQLKASGSYTEVYIEGEGMMMVSGNLKEYEGLLKGKAFFRSHQSHLVNMDHFDHFHKGDGGYLVMSDKSSVPLSSKKKSDFFDLLETL